MKMICIGRWRCRAYRSTSISICSRRVEMSGIQSTCELVWSWWSTRASKWRAACAGTPDSTGWRVGSSCAPQSSASCATTCGARQTSRASSTPLRARSLYSSTAPPTGRRWRPRRRARCDSSRIPSSSSAPSPPFRVCTFHLYSYLVY